ALRSATKTGCRSSNPNPGYTKFCTPSNLINQSDVLLGSAELSVQHLLLNYLVPFAVSAYSGLKAVHQNT
ncbi:hypothetical protein N0018_32975, partial [Pseudomonas aeruginosa]|nr:hypothetical protein [Pseudomonas aeruginosa]